MSESRYLLDGHVDLCSSICACLDLLHLVDSSADGDELVTAVVRIGARVISVRNGSIGGVRHGRLEVLALSGHGGDVVGHGWMTLVAYRLSRKLGELRKLRNLRNLGETGGQDLRCLRLSDSGDLMLLRLLLNSGRVVAVVGLSGLVVVNQSNTRYVGDGLLETRSRVLVNRLILGLAFTAGKVRACSGVLVGLLHRDLCVASSVARRIASSGGGLGVFVGRE